MHIHICMYIYIYPPISPIPCPPPGLHDFPPGMEYRIRMIILMVRMIILLGIRMIWMIILLGARSSYGGADHPPRYHPHGPMGPMGWDPGP